MAKNKNFLCYLLLVVALACSAQLHAQLREQTAAVYTAEIGVRELTGRNDGARVVEYLKAANLKKGDAWCAAFVTWTFKKVCVKTVISGYSPTWFPKSNVVYIKGKTENKKPLQADVFGIWFNSKNRIAHVGFIDVWQENSYCITVEGNTNEAGSREGDGVYRKRRLKSQIYKVSRWL